ncbi:MAG: DUF6062 family protein [Clostridia bacterium]|nr:DUF6062 family protein [Clostridia bacterium]
MKEQIYTIPVNEGFEEGGECPFCNMYSKLEKDAIDYMLGASYMEDDIRMETNKTGFCSKHYDMMYKEQNRLGMALMLHTHIQKINNDLEKLCAGLKSGEKKGLFSKTSRGENKVTPYLNNITNSCYICSRIKTNFDRYFDTFFYMWKKDNDMKDKVKASNGFCLDHFGMLIDMASKKLNGKDYDEFIDIVVPVQLENMKRLEKEVDHFTNKFDHNYKDVPWGTAKDALPRAILKTASHKAED